jgi:hypothetical protein
MVQSDLQQPEPGEAAPRPPSSRRPRRQSTPGLPWQWLGIAFLVVLIVAAVVYVVRGLPAGPPAVEEPTATPTAVQPTAAPKVGSPTPLPTVKPPTSTPELEPSPPQTEIEAGAEVIVAGTGVDGLSFRSGPGTKYARLKTIHDDDIFTVLEGPEEGDDYRWWRLEDEEGTVGWAVEDWLELTGK